MDAIVIMAREPRPNEVKTRLIPELDPETAAKLYNNFLLDRIAQVEGINGPQSFVAYTPESSWAFFSQLVPPGFKLVPQTGKDLGERLRNVSSNLFDQGYHKVVIIDSDSPNLPSRYIIEALKRLESEKVVLGTCEDGGYYLIGLSMYTPSLFYDIPWSTPRVPEVTLARAFKSNISVSMLDKWYDVDTFSDLVTLKRDLESHNKSERGAFFCKNTYQFLSRILI
jgi:rSAM/selenodomain-associated transferase 1